MMKLSEKLGFNLFYWDKHFKNALDLMQHVGVKYARPYWDFQSYEMSDDALAWHWRDDVIEQIVTRGLTPVLSFSAGEITDDRSWVDETRSYFSAREIEQFKNFVTQIIERYKQYDIIYEAWNEANGSFWVRSWDDAQNDENVIRSYIEFNNFIGQQVKKIAPNSKFCNLNSVYYPEMHLPQQEKKLSKVMNILSDNLAETDYISFHPYPLKEVDSGLPEVLMRDGKLSKLAIPLMYTELGYPIKSSWQGEWNVTRSADNIVRQILISDSIGVEAIIPYTLRTEQDHSLAEDLNGQFTLNNIGKAIFDLIAELGEYEFSQKIDTGLHTDFVDDLYVFEYRKGNELKIAYWCTMYPVKKQIKWRDYTPELIFDTKVQFLDYEDLAN